MKKGLFWIILVIIVIVLIAVFSGNKGSDETGPIKIGFTGPLSGEVASYGENARTAVEIAVEEINAQGGIDGRPLEVIYEDDVCNGSDAASAAQKLVNVDGVSIALSSVCSPAVLGSAPVFEDAGVVQFAYCATAPSISDAGEYIFRNVPSDSFQTKKAADYIVNELGKKKVAVVYVKNDWGVGLDEAIKSSLEELGGEVVVSESYEPASTDLRSQLTKVKDSDAEVLYFAGFPDGTTIGVRQINELGIDLPIVGADAWDSPKLWEDLGGLGDGYVFFASKTNSTDEFKTKMKERVGSDELIYCSNYAYDAIYYIAQAIEAVGNDSDKLKNYLNKTTFNGKVSQPVLKFDENGDPKDAVYVLKRVEGTELVIVE
jgi:branched-chain amino acid transport system substrate-binding protein